MTSEKSGDSTGSIHDSENVDTEQAEKLQAKRKMLKKLAVGAGIAATSPVWIKPVVKTVILLKSAMAASVTASVTPR